jgi:membrane-associated protease RseP (regulator of RpoE activity)
MAQETGGPSPIGQGPGLAKPSSASAQGLGAHRAQGGEIAGTSSGWRPVLFGAILFGALAFGAVGTGLVSVPNTWFGSHTAVTDTTAPTTAADTSAPANEDDQSQVGRIGVATQTLTPALARTLQPPATRTEGVLVTNVLPNTGAQEAGLRIGDILIGVDGVPLSTFQQLNTKTAMTPVGQTYQITFERAGIVQTVPVRVVACGLTMQLQCGTSR